MALIADKLVVGDEEEEDDDVDALRLAALRTLHTRKLVPVAHPSSSTVGTPHVPPGAMFGVQGVFRVPPPPQPRRALPPRGHVLHPKRNLNGISPKMGGGFWRHRTNSNLISIVPISNESSPETSGEIPKLVLPQDRYCKAPDVETKSKTSVPTKFSRYEDSDSDSSGESDEESGGSRSRKRRRSKLDSGDSGGEVQASDEFETSDVKPPSIRNLPVKEEVVDEPAEFAKVAGDDCAADGAVRDVKPWDEQDVSLETLMQQLNEAIGDEPTGGKAAEARPSPHVATAVVNVSASSAVKSTHFVMKCQEPTVATITHEMQDSRRAPGNTPVSKHGVIPSRSEKFPRVNSSGVNVPVPLNNLLAFENSYKYASHSGTFHTGSPNRKPQFSPGRPRSPPQYSRQWSPGRETSAKSAAPQSQSPPRPGTRYLDSNVRRGVSPNRPLSPSSKVRSAGSQQFCSTTSEPRRAASQKSSLSPRQVKSPHRYSPERGRSISPVRYGSPVRRHSRSPCKQRSLSPPRHCSRSPRRHHSPSPIRTRRSSSPSRRRSPSPRRRQQLSPQLSAVHRQYSPIHAQRSPPQRHHVVTRRRSPTPRSSSLSPRRQRFISPRRQRSPSPNRTFSPSLRKKRSVSPVRRLSPSPRRLRSPLRRLNSRSPTPPPRRLNSRSPTPRRLASRSPSPRRLKSRSPTPRRLNSGSPSPRRLNSLSPTPRRLKSRSPSPRRQRSPFPSRGVLSPPRRHASPRRLRSLSPRRLSPVRLRSPSPFRERSRSRSPCRDCARSPCRKHSSFSRRRSPSPGRPCSPLPRKQQSPVLRRKQSPLQRLASPSFRKHQRSPQRAPSPLLSNNREAGVQQQPSPSKSLAMSSASSKLSPLAQRCNLSSPPRMNSPVSRIQPLRRWSSRSPSSSPGKQKSALFENKSPLASKKFSPKRRMSRSPVRNIINKMSPVKEQTSERSRSPHSRKCSASPNARPRTDSPHAKCRKHSRSPVKDRKKSRRVVRSKERDDRQFKAQKPKSDEREKTARRRSVSSGSKSSNHSSSLSLSPSPERSDVPTSPIRVTNYPSVNHRSLPGKGLVRNRAGAVNELDKKPNRREREDVKKKFSKRRSSSRSPSSKASDRNCDDKPYQSKHSSGFRRHHTSGAKSKPEVEVDPVVEARKRKFESACMIDPNKKKIRLKSKTEEKENVQEPLKEDITKIKVSSPKQNANFVGDEPLPSQENAIATKKTEKSDWDDIEEMEDTIQELEKAVNLWSSDESDFECRSTSVPKVVTSITNLGDSKKPGEVSRERDEARSQDADRAEKRDRSKLKKEEAVGSRWDRRHGGRGGGGDVEGRLSPDAKDRKAGSEQDLRAELSRRRAERLTKAGSVHESLPARLVQSAFQSVVGSKALRKLEKEDEERRKKLEALKADRSEKPRRVTLLKKTDVEDDVSYFNITFSKGGKRSERTPSPLPVKMPVQMRLGIPPASAASSSRRRRDKGPSSSSRKRSRRKPKRNAMLSGIEQV